MLFLLSQLLRFFRRCLFGKALLQRLHLGLVSAAKCAMLFDVLGGGLGADGFVPDTFRSYLFVSRDIRLFGLVPVGLGVQGRCDLFACEDERAEKR